MKRNKKLSELHGPGSNFYSGRNLGISGADRNFSSYMSNKKFPLDYFKDYEDDEEEESEEMEDSILEKRVRDRRGRYRLQETFTLISESAGGDAIYKLVNDAVLTAIDEGTLEVGGLVMLIPRLAKNLTELHLTNKKVDAIFEKEGETDADIIELKQHSKSLTTDMADFYGAIIQAVPLPGGIDSAAMMALSQGSDQTMGAAADGYTALMDKLPDWLSKLIDRANSIQPGQKIIQKSLENISMINSIDDVGDLAKTPEELESDDDYQSDEEFDDQMDDIMADLDNEALWDIEDNEAPSGSKYADVQKDIDTVDWDSMSDWQKFLKGAQLGAKHSFNKGMNESSNRLFNQSLNTGTLGILLEQDDEDDLYEYEDYEDEDEQNEQAMAGGVPGVGMKLGYNADGSPTSNRHLKKLRSKQDIWDITETQNWSHKTLGRIKYK